MILRFISKHLFHLSLNRRQLLLALKWIGSLSITIAFLFILNRNFGERAVFREIYFKFISDSITRTYLLIGFSLMLVIQYLRSLRIACLVNGKFKLPSLNLFKVSCYHSFLNSVLPAKIGEASLPLFLAKDFNVELLRGATILVVLRIYDLGFVAIFGLVGILFFDSGFESLFGLRKIALRFILFLTIVLVLVFPYFVLPFLSRLGLRFQKLGAVEIVLRQICQLNLARWLLLITGLFTLTLYAIYFLVSLPFLPFLKWQHGALGAAVGSVSLSLPINGLANIGPMEAAWAGLLKVLGYDLQKAVLAGLAIHFVLLMGNGTLALLSWAHRLLENREKRNELESLRSQR